MIKKEKWGFIMDLSKRSLHKLESIKSAGKQLFNQYGYNRVTMDNVIHQSNVSRGTLYKYFADKQDLYETIVMDIYNMERESFKEIMSSNQNFLEKIKLIIEVRVNKYTDTHQKFFEDHFIRSETLNEYMKDYIQDVKRMRQHLYSEGRKEGFISPDISDKTLELYFDIIQIGLSQKYHDLSEMPKDDLTNVLGLIYAGMVSCK